MKLIYVLNDVGTQAHTSKNMFCTVEDKITPNHFN